ncbi:MAG: hypothetical protein ABII00_06185 [Elusimicrobiota bacterium]
MVKIRAFARIPAFRICRIRSILAVQVTVALSGIRHKPAIVAGISVPVIIRIRLAGIVVARTVIRIVSDAVPIFIRHSITIASSLAIVVMVKDFFGRQSPVIDRRLVYYGVKI